MDFPHGRLDYETLTTLNFFENVHEIINVKIHLHHLHVTGKIIAYAHDFCNMKVRENQNQSSCIGHSFFGFDRFFLMKGIRLSVWGTKDVNTGRTGSTNINFASISNQVKFIDTMKQFMTFEPTQLFLADLEYVRLFTKKSGSSRILSAEKVQFPTKKLILLTV